MFTPRRVITVAIVVAVLILAATLISLVSPETHGGLAGDTFGVRPYGLRGLYETVEEAGFEVQRGMAPPHAAAEDGGAGWMVLWRPDAGFVFRDERYLDELGAWVESGGAVLFAPEFDPDAYFYEHCECEDEEGEALAGQQNGTGNATAGEDNATQLDKDRQDRFERWLEAMAERQAERFHVLEPLKRMGVGVTRLGVTDYAGRMAGEREKLEAYRERQRQEEEQRKKEREGQEADGEAAQPEPPPEDPARDAPPRPQPVDPNTTAWLSPAAHAQQTPSTPADESAEDPEDEPEREYGWYDHRKFLRTLGMTERAERSVTRSVTPRGELGSLWRGLQTVTVSDETQCLLPPLEGEPVPDGALELQAHNGTTVYLAAAYRRGEGLVVVVADPLILANGMLARPGNAYTALGPLSHEARTGVVVFDEFFHGLTVRGKPMWLLTRRPYGLVALALVLAAALWCWRSGHRLGPPLPPVEPTRRTVEEYLEAMSGLFLRGEKQAFLARELKDGVLWRLGRRYRLGMGQENLEAVSKAMARRDPDGAQRLRNAVHELETLAAQRKPPVKKLVAAARELTRCL